MGAVPVEELLTAFLAAGGVGVLGVLRAWLPRRARRHSAPTERAEHTVSPPDAPAVAVPEEPRLPR